MKALPEGAKLTQEWIAVGGLQVDHRYQRPENELLIRKIVRDFDPDLIGALLASRRDDGTVVLLDGQQRREAVERAWGPAEKVPVLVYHGLTPEHEATIFVGFNTNRTKPKPLDVFRAKLAAADPAAMEIDRIVTARGYTLSASVMPMHVNAVVSIERVYEMAGPGVLNDTLSLLATVAIDEVVLGEMIVAVALLMVRYPRSLGSHRLATVIVAWPQRRWIAEARIKRADVQLRDSSMANAVARLMVEKYNRGLRSPKQRLQWSWPADSHTSTTFWQPAPGEGVDE